MNTAFLTGLTACCLGLPWAIRVLMHSAEVLNAAPVPTARPLATVIPLQPVKAAQESPQVVAPAPVGGAAPDLQPEVTPAAVKAGEVRRVQRPPCHDCACCTAYATRMKAAHAEIDKLRDDLLSRDARGIDHAASRQTGHGLARP